MESIQVVNIKCGGCANKIKTSLAKVGLKNISVSVDEQQVSFDGDRQLGIKILLQQGYPEVGSLAAASLLKKAQSYVSCALGRFGNK